MTPATARKAATSPAGGACEAHRHQRGEHGCRIRAFNCEEPAAREAGEQPLWRPLQNGHAPRQALTRIRAGRNDDDCRDRGQAQRDGVLAGEHLRGLEPAHEVAAEGRRQDGRQQPPARTFEARPQFGQGRHDLPTTRTRGPITPEADDRVQRFALGPEYAPSIPRHPRPSTLQACEGRGSSVRVVEDTKYVGPSALLALDSRPRSPGSSPIGANFSIGKSVAL